MIRIVLLLAAPLAVVAAPVPQESDAETVARLWGKVESPPGKYTAKPNGNALTLRSLGWPLSLEHGRPEFRVVREVVGDFDLRVKVVSLDAPNRTVRHEGEPMTGAGLFVEGGENRLTLFHWIFVHKDMGRLTDYTQDCIWMAHAGRDGGGGSYLAEAEPCKSVYLRIGREGKVITVHVSEDGKNWKLWPGPKDFTLPEKVTLGVFLGHSTSQVCEATFAEFRVEKPARASWFR